MLIYIHQFNEFPEHDFKLDERNFKSVEMGKLQKGITSNIKLRSCSTFVWPIWLTEKCSFYINERYFSKLSNPNNNTVKLCFAAIFVVVVSIQRIMQSRFGWKSWFNQFNVVAQFYVQILQRHTFKYRWKWNKTVISLHLCYNMILTIWP